MDSGTKELLIFEAHRKSTGASYLLWLFLGFFGAHRFYLGRKNTAVAQLLMLCSILGIPLLAVWWLIDGFRIPGMVRDANLETIRKLEGAPDDFEPAPRVEDLRGYSADPRVEEIRELSLSRGRLR